MAIAAEGGDAVEVPAALVDGDGDGLVAEVVSAQEDLVAVAVVRAVEPGGWRKLVSLVCVAEACGSVLDVGDGDCDAAAESDMLASEAAVMAKWLTRRCRCSLQSCTWDLPCSRSCPPASP